LTCRPRTHAVPPGPRRRWGRAPVSGRRPPRVGPVAPSIRTLSCEVERGPGWPPDRCCRPRPRTRGRAPRRSRPAGWRVVQTEDESLTGGVAPPPVDGGQSSLEGVCRRHQGPRQVDDFAPRSAANLMPWRVVDGARASLPMALIPESSRREPRLHPLRRGAQSAHGHEWIVSSDAIGRGRGQGCRRRPGAVAWPPPARGGRSRSTAHRGDGRQAGSPPRGSCPDLGRH